MGTAHTVTIQWQDVMTFLESPMQFEMPTTIMDVSWSGVVMLSLSRA
jgi:hypothetical protein